MTKKPPTKEPETSADEAETLELAKDELEQVAGGLGLARKKAGRVKYGDITLKKA
jgi:hypothetical protein